MENDISTINIHRLYILVLARYNPKKILPFNEIILVTKRK